MDTLTNAVGVEGSSILSSTMIHCLSVLRHDITNNPLDEILCDLSDDIQRSEKYEEIVLGVIAACRALLVRMDRSMQCCCFTRFHF
jgi:hypothetical protein